MEGNYESFKEPMVLCVYLVNTKRCWGNQCTCHDKMWKSGVLVGSSHFLIVRLFLAPIIIMFSYNLQI
jgi:hypothetical protein